MAAKGKGKNTAVISNVSVSTVPNILDVDESELKNMTDRDYTELYNFVKENFPKFKANPKIWPPIGKKILVNNYDTKSMDVYLYLKSKKSIDEIVEKYLDLYYTGIAFRDGIPEHLDIKTNFLRPIGVITFLDKTEAEKFKGTPGYDFFESTITLYANQKFSQWEKTIAKTNDKRYLYLRELAVKIRPIHTKFKATGNRTNLADMQREKDEILNFMLSYENFDIIQTTFPVQQIDSKIQSSSSSFSSNEEEDIGPLVATEFNSFEPIDFFPDRRIS